MERRCPQLDSVAGREAQRAVFSAPDLQQLLVDLLVVLRAEDQHSLRVVSVPPMVEVVNLNPTAQSAAGSLAASTVAPPHDVADSGRDRPSHPTLGSLAQVDHLDVAADPLDFCLLEGDGSDGGLLAGGLPSQPGWW